MLIGLYLPDIPGSWKSLEKWEAVFERKMDLVPIYQAWESQYKDFQTGQINRIQDKGLIPFITWEPWILPKSSEQQEVQPDFRLKTILAGRHDNYLRSWAEELNKLEKPLLLRPMHEMNGNWYPWCGTVNGNKVGEYVGVWKYLHRFLRQYVAPGIIQWVWSPYAFSYPPTEENAIPKYFPGDAFIDWVALDGYNWGNCKDGYSWQSFEEIFNSAYIEITRLSQKPLLIGETASTESGGSKAIWIKEAFKTMMKRFPHIKGIVWFNAQKECDWQLDSSKAAFEEFKAAVKLP